MLSKHVCLYVNVHAHVCKAIFYSAEPTGSPEEKTQDNHPHSTSLLPLCVVSCCIIWAIKSAEPVKSTICVTIVSFVALLLSTVQH